MSKPKIKATQNKANDVEKKPSLIPAQPSYRQAVGFIDQCVAMAPLSRQDHVQAQQALRQISGAINELEQLKNTKSKG